MNILSAKNVLNFLVELEENGNNLENMVFVVSNNSYEDEAISIRQLDYYQICLTY